MRGSISVVPDLWQLDGEVAQEDQLCAVPLLLCSRDFLLRTRSVRYVRNGGMKLRAMQRAPRGSLGRTFCSLYLFKYGMRSMMAQGIDRPKYTSSCITNDKMPVASTSFCIQAYQAAHIRSKRLRWTLYLEISPNWLQYVSGMAVRKVVEFLLSGASFSLVTFQMH